MAQRDIPGFYFDVEKGKYFRIQANHIAPSGAKYSQENVRKEKEQSRKRKRSAAVQQQREAQTVRRSKILTSAFASGISLWREQGRSHFLNNESRISAFVSQLQGYESLSLRSCESCGKRENIHDFVVDDDTDAVILALGSQNFGRIQHLTNSNSIYDLAAFRSDISSLCISASRTLVATAIERSHPGNVYVAGMTEATDGDGVHPILDAPAPMYNLLGGPETSLWTSKASPAGSRDVVAIGSSDGVFMLDAEGNLIQSHMVGEDVRSLDWLNQMVAVGGTRSRRVYLWDARTGGSSTRFHHSSSITGVTSLNNGSQVLVSGVKGAAIYDVRMTGNKRGRDGRAPSLPLVKMAPLVTQYPSQAMDVWPEADILATSDDENVVQLHSLTSGRLMGSLPGAGPPKPQGRIKRLRFIQTPDNRPTLVACQGSRLFEWAWGGPWSRSDHDGGDEDEEG